MSRSLFWLFLCGLATAFGQTATLADLAANLQLTIEFLTNAPTDVDCATTTADWGLCGRIDYRLFNNANSLLSIGSGFNLYFHSIRRVLQVGDSRFTLSHVTGDLHSLTLTENVVLGAKQALLLPLTIEYWTVLQSDMMPGAYITLGGSDVAAIQNTDVRGDVSAFVSGYDDFSKMVISASDRNVVQTPSIRYDEYSGVSSKDASEIGRLVIPTPSSVVVVSDRFFTYAASAVTYTTVACGTNNPAYYSLRISESATAGQAAVAITTCSDVGKKYADSTLTQLVSALNVVPHVTIVDQPQFEYRGFGLDVARHFRTVDEVKTLISAMSFYKMNYLHLRLADDEGWRLEMDTLTSAHGFNIEVASNRCHDLEETTCLLPQLGSGPTKNNEGSGHYTIAEFKDILQHAQTNFVKVIPEFDMPGHARAAVVTMEAAAKAGTTSARLSDPLDTTELLTVQFYNRLSLMNPCQESTYVFVEAMFRDVATMYKEAINEAPVFHIGGDEVKNIYSGGGFNGKVDEALRKAPFAESPACTTLLAEQQAIDPSFTLVDLTHKYFLGRVSGLWNTVATEIFGAAGEASIWHDLVTSSYPASNYVNYWDAFAAWGDNDGGGRGYELAQDYKLLVTNADFVYLDMPAENHPLETGYYWASRATDEKKIIDFCPSNLPQNAEWSTTRDNRTYSSTSPAQGGSFYGLEGTLFSESVRTNEIYEQKVFPRILAVAERAWSKPAHELPFVAGRVYSRLTDFTDDDLKSDQYDAFASVMPREMRRLEEVWSLKYRVPPVGAKVDDDGYLQMVGQFPGLPLQYSVDNGATWTLYNDNNEPWVGFGVTVWGRAASCASCSNPRFSRVELVAVGNPSAGAAAGSLGTTLTSIVLSVVLGVALL